MSGCDDITERGRPLVARAHPRRLGATPGLRPQVPLEHTVGLESLEPKQARGRREGVRGRDAAGVERCRVPGGARGSLDARGRKQPDELAAAEDDAELARLGLDAPDHHVQHRRVQLDDVRRHLDRAVGKLQAQRLDARQTATGLADRDRDRDRDVEGRLDLDVEGDERVPHPDEHGARRAVESGRAERRSELATLDPALQLGGPAAAVVRRPNAARKRSVEENGKPELLAHAGGDTACNRLRACEIRRHEWHDRHDVGGADPRVDADVRPKVDQATRRGNSCDEPVLEHPLAADEGEDGAVVTGIDVRVEEPRARRREGRRECRDTGRIAPLRDVGDGLEQGHPPTLEGVREPTAPAYYDRRAPEYDDWYLGRGLYADRDRPGFDDELGRVADLLASLDPARTLDIACGTGFLTRHLRGELTGLDASARMLAIAVERVPAGAFVRGDALALPFPDDGFDRVLSGHFYGHLDEPQRTRFLAEARRVAPELVLVDASDGHSDVAEEWSERRLRDGSRWEVFKRYFDAQALLAELGGGEVLHGGDWFVVVRSQR